MPDYLEPLGEAKRLEMALEDPRSFRMRSLRDGLSVVGRRYAQGPTAAEPAREALPRQIHRALCLPPRGGGAVSLSAQRREYWVGRSSERKNGNLGLCFNVNRTIGSYPEFSPWPLSWALLLALRAALELERLRQAPERFRWESSKVSMGVPSYVMYIRAGPEVANKQHRVLPVLERRQTLPSDLVRTAPRQGSPATKWPPTALGTPLDRSC
jgi:hypothetical protein